MNPALLSQLEELLGELHATFGPEPCQRLRTNLTALALGQPLQPQSRWQKPRLFFLGGLPEKAWYEAGDYPELGRVAALLEAAAPRLQAEYAQASPQAGLRRYPSSDTHGLTADDWSGCTLWNRGQFTAAAASFPETSALIQQLSEDLYPPSGEVVFLRLRPGAKVPAHHDATNVQLTCHLGIRVPRDCGILVGGETRTWREGRVLFFDHSFEHEVWNHSNEERVVLLLNLVHPALTAAERALLEVLAA